MIHLYGPPRRSVTRGACYRTRGTPVASWPGTQPNSWSGRQQRTDQLVCGRSKPSVGSGAQPRKPSILPQNISWGEWKRVGWQLPLAPPPVFSSVPPSQARTTLLVSLLPCTSSPFTLASIRLSQITPDILLHPFHPACTLFFTSLPHSPLLCTVYPSI